MSNKVQLIKQEIERIRKEVYNHNFAIDYSANGALDRVIRFIDSLTEEPASEDLDFLVISLEETIGTSPHSREVIKEHLQKAAEWGRNHFEDRSEMVSEDLEEEIESFWDSHDGSMNKVEYQRIVDCANHFTEWQRQKDQETIELAEEHAMLAGMNKMKEEMMKNAVEGRVQCGYGDGNKLSIKAMLPQDSDLKYADKVKVLILKIE